MLLEFKAENYKSFRNMMTFSLIPSSRQRGLDYSILREKIGRRTYKGLCSSVIYGPNASGKTNMVGAFDTFKNIILRGHIRNDRNWDSPNTAAGMLELIPNNLTEGVQPVNFNIKFIENGILIEYGLSFDLGDFLESDYERKILKEYLKINEVLIFDREEELEIDNLKTIKNYLVRNFEEGKESLINIAKNNLDDEELFLVNGFKAMFSPKLAALISNWFNYKLDIIYRSDSLQLKPTVIERQKNRSIIIEPINEAAKLFGINSNDLSYVVDKETKEPKLCSVFEQGIRSRSTAIPAEIFESYGTIRFTNIFPLILDTIFKGGVLIVDEFDASIHPMALVNIVNIFHNDDVNKNNAQLIFNTHNPIFLNPNLFRKDEIKFVERSDITHYSTHYSLADFGIFGPKAVHQNEDYMKNYFIDRYGAIRDIDFISVFEKVDRHYKWWGFDLEKGKAIYGYKKTD